MTPVPEITSRSLLIWILVGAVAVGIVVGSCTGELFLYLRS